MRLLRSIFELRIDGVPNRFIAEGYDLNPDYVGQLCRKFQVNSEKEYLDRRNEVLAGMAAGEFYSEPVYLDGQTYRAVFSADKKTFYTVLPEEDIRAVLQSLTEIPDRVVRKSSREPVALYAFSEIAPLRRRAIAGLFDAMQEAQVECRYRISEMGTDVPEELRSRLRKMVESDDVDIAELRDYLSEKENFRAIHTSGVSSFGRRTYLYRTWEKAKRVADLLTSILSNGIGSWEEETRKQNSNKRIKEFSDFAELILEGTTKGSRLSVTEAMEQAFVSSQYSITERFRRLQFYNEPSVLSLQGNKRYQMPAMKESDGMPDLADSQIGRGIPVACLEHLLHNGLLQMNHGGIKCVRHRQKQLDGCCTLDCPFEK